MLIFVAVVAVFPPPQLPFSSFPTTTEMGLGMGMGITSASPGMWKCCCNFCCCRCCCCCCILLCLVYCTNARFGSGLHSQWGQLVSNPLAGNLCVVIESNWSARNFLSASFVDLISQRGSLKTHLNQRQHPLDSVYCTPVRATSFNQSTPSIKTD